MAQLQRLIRADIDPTKPVQEVTQIISALCFGNPDERLVLEGIQKAIEARLEALKGAEQHGKPIRDSNAKREDQG